MQISLMSGYSVFTGPVMRTQYRPTTGFEPAQLHALATGDFSDLAPSDRPNFARTDRPPSQRAQEPGKGTMIDLLA
jgi:hypothetical protein